MFCTKCGNNIDDQAVICPACGVPTANYQQQQPQQPYQQPYQQPPITIVNTNTNTNMNAAMMGRMRNKWTALILCFFLGYLGVHKFYEGKAGMGILYIFTLGLFGIGVLVDLITLLLKPNPYFV